jgi:hypothetical protein
MDLQVLKKTFSAGGFRHLKTDVGIGDAETITCDVSLFTKATHYVDGFLKAGIVLAKVTSTGKYGPYAGDLSESVSIAVDATGGTWRINFQGETTADLAFNISAANLKLALELLDDINVGDIAVSGGPGNAGGTTPYVIAFTPDGQYGGRDAPAITTTVTGTPPLLTGGAATAVVTTTAGGSASSNGLETPAGLLLDRVPVNLVDVPTALVAALQWHGHIIEPNLPIAALATGGGFIDAHAKAVLGDRFRWVAA